MNFLWILNSLLKNKKKCWNIKLKRTVKISSDLYTFEKFQKKSEKELKSENNWHIKWLKKQVIKNKALSKIIIK